MLTALLEALDRTLAPVAVAEPFRAALARLEPADACPPAAAPSLPVVRHWDDALAGGGDLARALAPLAGQLRWHQTYRADPPSPRFLDEYGYSDIVGLGTAVPTLLRSEELALGLLMLGPEIVYPPHVHPAEELYLPLGPAEWWRDGGDWEPRSAGEVVHHAPNVPHATRTGAEPLAALYLWIGEIRTKARLLEPG